MSVYASFCCMDGDEQYPAPHVYQASHILPTPGDRRGGSLDLGLIPGHVTQDGWCVLGYDHSRGPECLCEPLNELPPVWPYLRVGLAVDNSGDDWQAVVLDRSQVIALRDELTGWIGRTLEGDPATPHPEGEVKCAFPATRSTAARKTPSSATGW